MRDRAAPVSGRSQSSLRLGRLKRCSGFTLAELIMVMMLSSIIFAGLAAMYASAFRAEFQAFRQEMLQGSATLAFRRRSQAGHFSSAGPDIHLRAQRVGLASVGHACWSLAAGS